MVSYHQTLLLWPIRVPCCGAGSTVAIDWTRGFGNVPGQTETVKSWGNYISSHSKKKRHSGLYGNCGTSSQRHSGPYATVALVHSVTVFYMQHCGTSVFSAIKTNETEKQHFFVGPTRAFANLGEERRCADVHMGGRS